MFVEKSSKVTPFGVENNLDLYQKTEDDTFVFGTAKNLTKQSGIDVTLKFFHDLKTKPSKENQVFNCWRWTIFKKNKINYK